MPKMEIRCSRYFAVSKYPSNGVTLKHYRKCASIVLMGYVEQICHNTGWAKSRYTVYS